MLTAKRVLYVANVDESDLEGKGPLVQKVRDRAAAEKGDVVAVCARLEAEIAELDEADRAEMLASVGLPEPALAVLARETTKKKLAPKPLFERPINAATSALVPAPRILASSPAIGAASSCSSSSLTAIRIAWKVRRAGCPP